MFGAFAPFPIRLGGQPDSGWTAQQQSRVAADMVTAFRSSSLAILTIDQLTGAITSYHGQNGVGLANAPRVTAITPTVYYELEWDPAYKGPLWAQTSSSEDQTFPWAIQQVQVFATGIDLPIDASAAIIGPTTLRVIITGTGGSATVEVWGTWLPLPSIGTYDGDPSKENSETEGETTYAASVYQELLGMRGSLYTQERGTYVHCENLALARFWGYFSYRLPEKVRANATPNRADERLGYWAEVLGVGVRPGEERWSLRKRCTTQYAFPFGPNFDRVNQAVSDLLGGTLVEIKVPDELDLTTNPAGTYWPIINPGWSGADLGGGTWTSSRAQMAVRVVWLPTLSWGEFTNLLDVQMWQLLDTLLPAWVTWTWYQDEGSLGFLLDISHLDVDGFDP